MTQNLFTLNSQEHLIFLWTYIALHCGSCNHLIIAMQWERRIEENIFCRRPTTRANIVLIISKNICGGVHSCLKIPITLLILSSYTPLPNRHWTLKRCFWNVVLHFVRRINVQTTTFWRLVPTGHGAGTGRE